MPFLRTGKNAEQGELPHSVGGLTALENWQFFLKLDIHLPYYPEIPFQIYAPREICISAKSQVFW